MKTIELTTEQKEKLLEMCNKLFNHEGIWFQILDENIYYSKTGKFPGFKIHWFEFCITHLAYKIYTAFYSLEVCDDMLGAAYYQMIINQHPVDYLYEKFKKLKL